MRTFKALGAMVGTVLFLLHVQASAQFNSGSTGADGALDTSTMSCPNNVCEVQLPPSGVLNYTTVNVSENRVLRFKQNSRNTPVILLVRGDVVINGAIDVSASGRYPGPGGFYGGSWPNSGYGPGGGQIAPANAHGRWVGPLSLNPIVGGSGGAPAAGTFGGFCDGGGGGGAILIASSTSIIMSGPYGGILTNGGNASAYACPSGLGSGGAIRLVSNLVTIGVNIGLWATGANAGVVRIEATNISFTGSSSPAAVLSPINPNVISNSPPQLTIASVGGYTVPSYAGSRFDTVDILLPNSIPDPVNVVIQAVNIPAGTLVQVGFVSGSPNGTATSCTLTGGPGPVGCTATISNLVRTGVTYLLATAAFDPPAPVAMFNRKGADNISKIKLESVLGAKPKYVFLRSDNSVIDHAKVPKEILLYFGM